MPAFTSAFFSLAQFKSTCGDGDPSLFFRPCVVNFLVQGGLLPTSEHGQGRPCGGPSASGRGTHEPDPHKTLPAHVAPRNGAITTGGQLTASKCPTHTAARQ